MTREFKFRGWVNDSGNFDENDEPIPMMLYGDALAFEEYMPINDLFLQIPMMQCTGLKDDNGVDIYEGDIVRAISYYHEIDFIGEVVFQDCSFEIKGDAFTMYDWPSYEVEVLGNIYENPELLEVFE